MTDHVLTGASGFVGGHLLADLLADTETGTAYALARGSGHRSAAERIDAALARADHRGVGRERLVAIDAELTEPSCGVSAVTIPRADGRLVFWHLAASLQWRPGRREEVIRTNVDGTRHALELAASLGADLFVYMSTAYTCGTMSGDIPEELHRPPGFGNIYEESKCAAEHVVSEFTGARTLILRPSVIVGSSTDHRPCGSYTGLYGYLSELRRFKEMLGDSDETVRFTADRSTRISYIPVDCVVADARAVVASELDTPRQDIYHLSGASESATGEVSDYILGLLGLEQRLFIVDDDIDDPSTLERFFAKRIAFFSSYLRREKRFVRTAPPERGIPLAELIKFIDAESMLSAQSRPVP
jgi:nucleoside-diphosphate-sugar epimerase